MPLGAEPEATLVAGHSPPREQSAQGEKEDEISERKHDRLLTTEQHACETIRARRWFLPVVRGSSCCGKACAPTDRSLCHSVAALRRPVRGMDRAFDLQESLRSIGSGCNSPIRSKSEPSSRLMFQPRPAETILLYERSRLRTPCALWFAWASIAWLAWLRICALARFVVS